MDALMAALVAAALAQVGDRTAWLAAILSDRYRKPGLVIAMAALALLVASGLAATLGTVIGPKLSPNAQQLMLALALLLQGGGSFFPAKAPERLDRWKIGAIATTALGLFILAFGDGVQFIVLTLAARTPVPALAAIGATIGALVVNVPAILAGEQARRTMPITAARIGIGMLFLLAGLYLALGAIRLI